MMVDKSPGLDQIHAGTQREASEEIAGILAEIYESSLDTRVKGQNIGGC